MKRAIMLLGFGVAMASAAVAQSLVVRGGVVYPVGAPAIRDGVVVITDGKIVAVGPSAEVFAPTSHRVLEAAVVTPGLIDARSVVGLSGHLNQPHDQDQLERSSAMQPELRAIDAYNPDERLVEWVRSFGVTTLHTGHAPGALISGQTMIVKTAGVDYASSIVDPLCMVACSLGSAARAEGDKAPGNRSKAIAMLRQRLLEAQAHGEKLAEARDDPDTEAPARDLGLEVLVQVLEREVPLLVFAHHDRDIEAALRLAAEFDIALVLDGAAEAYRLLDGIRTAQVPVIAHAPMMRSSDDAENATMTLGATLRDAGVRFAYQSGFESYVPKTRVILFEAAIGAAYGLGFEGALRAVTLDAAAILGVAGRLGSIEVGKDGDLALYDGDPFEYTTHCVATVIEGRVVFEGAR